MRTTLIIDDQIMRELKVLASKRGRTISSLVEAFLKQGLERERKQPPQPLPAVPTFSVGRVKVDIADRDALYRAMEGET